MVYRMTQLIGNNTYTNFNINLYFMFKEKLLSSIENLNGTTSARYTARNINAMFILSVVIGGGIIGSVFGFFSPDDEYTQCIEDYTKQVDEVRQRNDELVSSCYKEYKDNV